jgi:NAD(P)-dependent dehydrogenase (short-subunit alcohol dehydrogenase family)
MRLMDKVTIVTGAANGIGRGIAEVFAEQGAWVMVADLDAVAGEEVVRGIRAKGGNAVFERVDISHEEEISRAVKTAAGAKGRVHALVNNAAYIAPWHDVESSPREEWDKNFSITLMGAANFIKATLPYMLPFHEGSIINISSVQGVVAARTSAAYTSIKHALIGLTRSVAYDYGTRGIRVNAIAPGAIRTRVSPAEGSDLHQRQISKTMLGRIGDVRDVAWAAVYLASEESSSVTGAVIPVDGGWTAI